MKTLQDQLKAIKSRSAAMMTPEITTAMQKGFKALADSNVMGKVLKVGDPAPAFALPNAQGQTLRSRTLLSRGPLVILFYRGKW